MFSPTLYEAIADNNMLDVVNALLPSLRDLDKLLLAVCLSRCPEPSMIRLISHSCPVECLSLSLPEPIVDMVRDMCQRATEDCNIHPATLMRSQGRAFERAVTEKDMAAIDQLARAGVSPPYKHALTCAGYLPPRASPVINAEYNDVCEHLLNLVPLSSATLASPFLDSVLLLALCCGRFNILDYVHAKRGNIWNVGTVYWLSCTIKSGNIASVQRMLTYTSIPFPALLRREFGSCLKCARSAEMMCLLLETYSAGDTQMLTPQSLLQLAFRTGFTLEDSKAILEHARPHYAETEADGWLAAWYMPLKAIFARNDADRLRDLLTIGLEIGLMTISKMREIWNRTLSRESAAVFLKALNESNALPLGVSTVDARGHNVLFWAIKNCSLGVVRVVLQAGVPMSAEMWSLCHTKPEGFVAQKFALARRFVQVQWLRLFLLYPHRVQHANRTHADVFSHTALLPLSLQKSVVDFL